MEFVETPSFTRHVADYLDDDAYSLLQNALVENPDCGDLMPGTGGFRKMRWADPRRGKGRRGGLRVIYYHFESYQQIWLMMAYDKNEMNDLSSDEKRALKAAVAAELHARKIRRSTGRRTGRSQ